MGSGRPLRIRRQLGHQHRQRVSGWRSVLAQHLVGPRRRRVCARRAPGHQGRADRRRGTRAGHPGQGCLAVMWRSALRRDAPQRHRRCARGTEQPAAAASAAAGRPLRSAATACAVRRDGRPAARGSASAAGGPLRSAATACTVRRDGRPAARGSASAAGGPVRSAATACTVRRDGRPTARGSASAAGGPVRSAATACTVRRDGRPTARGSACTAGRPVRTARACTVRRDGRPTPRGTSCTAGRGTARACTVRRDGRPTPRGTSASRRSPAGSADCASDGLAGGGELGCRRRPGNA